MGLIIYYCDPNGSQSHIGVDRVQRERILLWRIPQIQGGALSSQVEQRQTHFRRTVAYDIEA